MNPIYEHNRRAWDSLVRQNHDFTLPVRAEQLDRPLASIDPYGWLEGVAGKTVLCLAAGGGKYSVLFAELGAQVTVVDLSPAMLAIDRQIAAARKLDIRTVERSMDDLSSLPPASFDIVAQPVSTCYVPDIAAVYREVARVTRPGGLYVSQHKQPASLQADVRPSSRGYELTEPYYRTGPLPSVPPCRHRESGTLEFLHRWEQLIGSLCRAGFVIEDLAEPLHADSQAVPHEFAHRSRYVAPYVCIKARRLAGSECRSSTPSMSWT